MSNILKLKLRLRATLREWTDWKSDLQRAYRGAPVRYGTDFAKIIKANHEQGLSHAMGHLC